MDNPVVVPHEGEIEWGPEIETGCRFPEWLSGYRGPLMNTNGMGDWQTSEDIMISPDWHWKYIDKLRLPANHPSYEPTPSQPASPPHESAGPLSTPPTQAQGTEMKS